jgi:rare lipoprotein A
MVILCFRLSYLLLVWSVAAAAPTAPLRVEQLSVLPLAAVGDSTANLLASWYGPEYHGLRTASGEVFDMHQLTAAHRDLPFGARLRLTEPQSGRSVLVRINDRGPFLSGRDLDLSLAAARQLGIERQGLATVHYQRLPN